MKYEFTGETKTVNGVTVRQIKRISDGTIGGYIESEKNLDQNGSCFVYDDAVVTGNAEVSGNACVFGNAKVYGNASVFGNAKVYGNARVFDASVSGNARVFGNEVITD